MRVLINQRFGRFTDDVRRMTANFAATGRVIYGGRNEIRVAAAADGTLLNVKRYRQPSIFNRLIYTFVRKPKGLRSFNYAARLAATGVDTPEAVAYVERRRHWLIGLSYLVTLQSPLSRNFYEFGDKSMDNPADVEIVRQFAVFTAHMHTNGVLHRDYSPGNILFDVDSSGKVSFTIVDTNRMSFGNVNLRRGVENMARLWGQPKFFEILTREYCKARGQSDMTVEAMGWINSARHRFWDRFSRRHPVKFTLRY